MKTIIFTIVVVVALFSRLIPHPVNMTALGALALFAGTAVKPRIFAIALPLLIMLISDLILGFHNTMFFVYAAWVIIAIGAGLLLHNGGSWTQRGFVSLFASLVFFAISNFGVWFVGDLYPRNIQGFIECYLMAIPFLQNQILGDLIFTGVIFAVSDRLQMFKTVTHSATQFES